MQRGGAEACGWLRRDNTNGSRYFFILTNSSDTSQVPSLMRSIYAFGTCILLIFILLNVDDAQTAECKHLKKYSIEWQPNFLLFELKVSVCATCTYVSISSAIAAAVSGYTINITAGSYTEPMFSIPFSLTFVYVFSVLLFFFD